MIAVVAPVGLLLVVALVLAFQIVKLTDAGRLVDQTDEVMERIGEVQNQIIDQETGIRGYLLSNDREFLAPYERAQPLPMFAALHQLVADNPPQQVRVDAARARYEAWLALAEVIVRAPDPSPYRQKEALTERLIQSNRELQTRLQELNVLYSVGKTVTSVSDLSQLLPRIVDAAQTARGRLWSGPKMRSSA